MIYRNAIDINGSPAMRRFLLSLERNCTADCCKSSAFEVNTDNIEYWIKNESVSNEELVYEELFNLKDIDFNSYQFVNLKIRHLESYWTTKEFLEFVDVLLHKLHKVIYKGRGSKLINISIIQIRKT